MEASRFLATTLWICTELKVTVGAPERERRRRSPRTTRAAMPHESLLDEASVMARTANAACVRDELVRDSWRMITGFLKDGRVNRPHAAAIICVEFLRAGPRSTGSPRVGTGGA